MRYQETVNRDGGEHNVGISSECQPWVRLHSPSICALIAGLSRCHEYQRRVDWPHLIRGSFSWECDVSPTRAAGARGPACTWAGPLACCVERPDQLSNNVGEGGPMLKLSGPLRFSLIPSAHAGPEPVGPSTFEVMAGL